MSVFIIAEIGINHNGDADLAKQLIRVAADCGCDAVKFQKRTVERAYTKEFLDSPRESPWGHTQRDQKMGLELGQAEYEQIDVCCKECGIQWLASAWDVEAQHFLRSFDLAYNKIASAMLTHTELLRAVAEEGKHTFISTGMSTVEEIDAAVGIFREAGCPFELMHCNSTYPMKEKDANLRTIGYLRDRYGCDVGYSGHETDILVSTCAVAVGASSVERHITLDRSMYGSDQKASLEPHELSLLVQQIRRCEGFLGAYGKALNEGELSVRRKLRGTS